MTVLRVVHKESSNFQRKTSEMNVDKVEASTLPKPSLADINYGDVMVFGVGEGGKDIKTIASPLAFRNAITAR